MTPMVDVVMVLLVFFMASAAFVGPEWFLRGLIPKRLEEAAGPNAGARSALADLPTRPIDIALGVGDEGRVTATGMRLTGVAPEEVLAALAKFVEGEDAGKIDVRLLPAANVPYREVVRFHEGLQRLRITRVGYGRDEGNGRP
jgi:biopolymer transport protein ExbD